VDSNLGPEISSPDDTVHVFLVFAQHMPGFCVKLVHNASFQVLLNSRLAIILILYQSGHLEMRQLELQ
jgi:hypothetical protein